METKNEYIASIMLEAAELLKNDSMDESAGANGAGRRYYEEKIKSLQAKANSLKKKADMYKRAGYGDTGPASKYNDIMKKIKYFEDAKEYLDTRNGDARAADRSKTGSDGMYYEKDFHKKDSFRGWKEVDNRRINNRAKALKEAIDLLYEKAVLCEDAAEAEGYVQKAEELQKAIEDIPEEKPVKQDEYNTSTVGGDDEKPDLDEIKDLCDNDPEVIKLLTDDEDKSVTVDSEGCSNCNESVYDFFNLDF